MPALKRICALVTVAVVAACATIDPPLPLPEGRWELLSSSFVDSGRLPGVPRATLEIRNGRIAVFSGCNHATGGATAVDGKMMIPALAATRRACPEPLGGFEGRLFKMLHAQPYFRTEAGVLTLAAGDLSVRMRRLPEAQPAAKPAQP